MTNKFRLLVPILSICISICICLCYWSWTKNRENLKNHYISECCIAHLGLRFSKTFQQLELGMRQDGYNGLEIEQIKMEGITLFASLCHSSRYK